LALVSAAVVVLSVAAAILINELHGGWGWWVAMAVVVVVWAAAVGWQLYRGSVASPGGERLGRGAVRVGRDVAKGVRTAPVHADASSNASTPGADRDIGAGAVWVGRDVGGEVDTTGGFPLGRGGAPERGSD
jgi:hypothetical protein